MWARAAGAALAFINAIVITPLDKLGAHPFAADRSTQSELVTPFGEVGLAENVSVICSPPNEHLWARWNGIPLPINEGHGAGHLNRVARLGGLGTEKERHPVIRIGEIGSIGMNWSIRATPIDTDSHVFDWRCPAVFPARLGREPRDKEPGIISVWFRQNLIFNDAAIGGGSQFNIEPVKKNEGTFRLEQSILCDGDGISGEFNLLLPSSPKIVSGQPQADGGDRKDNRERANDALVVTLKESVQRIEADDYSRAKGGAIFLIIVISGLLIVRWLYEAQR